MTFFRDLSLNGGGVELGDASGNLIDTSADRTINAKYIRVGGAGDLVLRYPSSNSDITIAATAGEYVPVAPGTIVRSTGTTATALHSLGDLRQ